MAKTRTRAQELLAGMVLRLQLPNMLTAFPVGMAAVYYLIQTTPLPREALRPVITAAVVATAVLVPVLQLVYGRLLGTLGKVASGKLPPSVENLQTAARQAYRFGDRIVVLIAFVWLAAVVSNMVALGLSNLGLPRVLLLRMAGRTLLFLPTGMATTSLLTAYAARGVVERIQQCGLTIDQLLDAVPARRQLRLRVVLFMLVLTGTPALMSIDLVSALTERAVGQVRSASPELQQFAAALALDHARTTVLVLGGFILLLGLFGAMLWGAAIGGPMRALAAQADRIAAGDLSSSQVSVAEDELWAVSAAVSRLQADLTRLLSDMQRAGFSVSTAADQMLSHAESSRSGAANQALSAHQTSSATEEMARVAEQIAEKAGSVAETAAQTLSAARQGQDSSRVFNDAINSLARDNLAVADAVVRLKKGMNQIGRIVEFINGIADKSDLLALNAELEGTKAGDLGRGFSLVAGEMRRLAENIMKSTREISQLIEEVRDATQAAVSATETGIHATETGAQVAETLAQSLQKIVELAQATAESATTINFATQQQRSSSAQLAETMQSILEVTQSTEAATNNVSSSSTDLAQLARQLKGAVERFKLQV
ncbi:MAG TPA: methyl-accepting chemotaxis protein [Myxococcales bacterium]|nr:methyl-accepting chemotaxis protein [Myxococcales bacterium]